MLFYRGVLLNLPINLAIWAGLAWALSHLII